MSWGTFRDSLSASRSQSGHMGQDECEVAVFASEVEGTVTAGSLKPLGS